MTLSTLEVGLIIGLLLSVIALAVAVKSLLVARGQQAEFDKMAERLSHEIALSTTGVVNIGQRLIAVEKRLLADSIPPIAPQKTNDPASEESQPYSQAAQLFKLGVDCDEVARRCGLSRAEASLIQAMQLKTSDVKS